MSEKHSIASKARWANIPKEERSKIMSERAKKKNQNMSEVEKKDQAIKMNKGRWKKN